MKPEATRSRSRTDSEASGEEGNFVAEEP